MDKQKPDIHKGKRQPTLYMDDMKVRLSSHVAISPFFTLFVLFAIITKQQLLSLSLKLIFKNIDFVLLLICFSHTEGN